MLSAFFAYVSPTLPNTHTHTHSNAVNVQRNCIKRARLWALKIMASPIFCLEVSHIVNWLPRAQSKFILSQKGHRWGQEHAAAKKLEGKLDKGYTKIYCMGFCDSTYRLFRSNGTHTRENACWYCAVFFRYFLGLCCLVALIELRAAFDLRRLQLPNV